MNLSREEMIRMGYNMGQISQEEIDRQRAEREALPPLPPPPVLQHSTSSPSGGGGPVPTRKTDQSQVDQWNAQMRQSPVYLQYMQSQGLPTDGRVKLSKSQQEGLEKALAAAGMPVPGGMHIDQGGNLNQKNRLVRNTAIAAGIAAGGYFAAPAIAGALGAGGAASGAGAAALPTSLAGEMTGLVSGTTAMAGTGGAAGGAGWLASLGGAKGVMGLAGTGLSAYANSQAQNRDATLGAQSDMERAIIAREGLETVRDRDQFDQGIAREQEGRVGRDDAWKKLLSAQRTLSPGPRPQLSPYSVAPRQATDMERSGAEAMTQEVMGRLQGGNPIQAPARRAPLGAPAMDPSLMKPGGLESTLGWLSPLLQAGSRIPMRGSPPISSKMPIRY
jgi:hypothetical protein